MQKPTKRSRLNRSEFWLGLSSIGLYILSLTFFSLGDEPTKYSLAFSDLQAFFKGAAVVFGGMCVGVVCTKHSIVEDQQPALIKSAMYAVRALIMLGVVLAVT